MVYRFVHLCNSYRLVGSSILFLAVLYKKILQIFEKLVSYTYHNQLLEMSTYRYVKMYPYPRVINFWK